MMGKDFSDTFTVGLRFLTPGLEQGQHIKYARLRPAAQGGCLATFANLTVRGIDEDSSEPLSGVRRPSILPKTEAAVPWTVRNLWQAPGDNLGLRYSSPNIACIVNEILARPGWGEGPAGKALIVTIEGGSCLEGEANYLVFEDYNCDTETRDEAVLEVYPTLADAFVGKPMLGRPTDTAVIIQAVHLLDLDVYAEYGTCPCSYTHATPPLLGRAGSEPIEIAITGLQQDARYYYRIRYRECGDSVYLAGMEGDFHTQRAGGEGYGFTIQADSHIWPLANEGDLDGLRLYEQTIRNIGLDQPDFNISMGDFAHVEDYARRSVLSLQEAVDKYLGQREYLDKALHSIPFFLVLGNHEGEQGWRLADPGDSVAVWGVLARKRTFVNPFPDGFYSGDSILTEGCGLRHDYYSWEWGDALFVVLDPFWYTSTKPHSHGGGEGSEDPWDWTLGVDQYNWLYDSLHGSDATWKFVFIHHLVGGVLTPNGLLATPYGRGGIEAAKFAVDGLGSYEWGGEDENGNYVFPDKRPGWGHGPIHDMLTAEGVTILFHGHDHVFAHQVLDGVVYQACPQPSDPTYGDGWCSAAQYLLGEKRNNSGHLRVRVLPEYVQVDYVRSVLPEDEPLFDGGLPVWNGQVSYSYSTGLAGSSRIPDCKGVARLLGVRPNPFASKSRIDLIMARRAPVSVRVYDIEGRLVSVLFDGTLSEGEHEVVWDAGSGASQGKAPGTYFIQIRTAGSSETCKALLIR
jgi:hypothetical protein